MSWEVFPETSVKGLYPNVPNVKAISDIATFLGNPIMAS